MAKVIENSIEPSQSSTSLPPLADNEVELVIDRFWRDTRPRVCVRSETKMVNGFNFRLLVWPQGSKQSQSHLSAFVEVVPPSGNFKDTEDKSDSGKDHVAKQYPPDWACPCVFYRISVMNFKQKYPYSKADTWTFSYVCPDRGWHTLLDTRYINRRDGYLSNEGSLVIRAIAFPRFAHPVGVLPLLSSVSHEKASNDSSMARFGLSNLLATDHVNALVRSLFHLGGFRKFIYSLVRKSANQTAASFPPTYAQLEGADLASVKSGLESCVETIREIMDRISASSADISRLIQADFYSDCLEAGLCKKMQKEVCGDSEILGLVRRYGRCRVLINCIEEALFSVSSSLGRKRVIDHKRVQLEAYQQIVKDCRRILTSVCNPLFQTSSTIANPTRTIAHANPPPNLIEELQLVFAKLEFAADATSTTSTGTRLICTRGLLRELGVTSGGLACAATPDGLFHVFFGALKKAVFDMQRVKESGDTNSGNVDCVSSELGKLIEGRASMGGVEEPFTQIRFSPSKSTTIEKHLNVWSQLDSSQVGADGVGCQWWRDHRGGSWHSHRRCCSEIHKTARCAEPAVPGSGEGPHGRCGANLFGSIRG